MGKRSLPTKFGFAWSCNSAGPGWEQPDTVTITEPAADSLKNTSVGFASGQPSLSSSNTVAVDPQAGHGGRQGSRYHYDDLLLYIPTGAYTSYLVCFLAYYNRGRCDKCCKRQTKRRETFIKG